MLINLPIRTGFALSLLLSLSQARPNFIVIQPDDLEWLEAWGSVAHFDTSDSSSYVTVPAVDLIPNIERLRNDGLTMEKAYAASSMCGTSRYSTITGRYPSRSSYGRRRARTDMRNVVIPRTKLEDLPSVNDGNDCSVGNLAATFSSNGYRTGMVGKWHLGAIERGGLFDHEATQNKIKTCGFDFAGAIYPDNLNADWTDGFEDMDVNHNMEHLTSEALFFLEESIDDSSGDPFFLYFNPTVPHGSGDVRSTLESVDCRETVAGIMNDRPPIAYGRMNSTNVDDRTCQFYRQSVLDRAPNSRDDKELGMIWIDDAIESIILLLEDRGQLDNTFILFQMDHGVEGKSSLFEPGVRIAQFIHYPDGWGKGGQSFGGLVSTVDIGPTMLEIAGISSSYFMDGESWYSAVTDPLHPFDWENDRCLVFELGFDRAIRCGCNKFLFIGDTEDSSTVDTASRLGYTLRFENMYNLCDNEDIPEENGEELLGVDMELYNSMVDHLDCHLDKTDSSMSPDYSTKCWSWPQDVGDVIGVGGGSGGDTPCEDSDLAFEVRNGRLQTCQWVARNSNRRCRDFGEYCLDTCNLC